MAGLRMNGRWSAKMEMDDGTIKNEKEQNKRKKKRAERLLDLLSTNPSRRKDAAFFFVCAS
jgi:hypothetical protein